MLSHMPGKVLKLLEFVGFSGNRDQGLQELETSTFLTDGLRCPLATLIMLVYQCYIEHIFGECLFGEQNMNLLFQLDFLCRPRRRWHEVRLTAARLCPCQASWCMFAFWLKDFEIIFWFFAGRLFPALPRSPEAADGPNWGGHWGLWALHCRTERVETVSQHLLLGASLVLCVSSNFSSNL